MNSQEVVNLVKELVPGLVKAALDNYFTDLKNLPQSDWSQKEGAFTEATKIGLTDGSEPQMFITREQAVSILSRFDKASNNGVFKEV